MTANHDQPNRAPILTQMVENLHDQLDNPILANSPVIREIRVAQTQAEQSNSNKVL